MHKKLIKKLIAAVSRSSGVCFLIREVLCRRKATIVLYHKPSPQSLRAHFEYIGKHYNVITLDDLVDALHSGTWSSIPPKALVVTIDDGFKENRSLVDVFKEHGITPTIFLATGVIKTNRKFWFTFNNSHENSRLRKMTNIERLMELKRCGGYTLDREYSERQGLSEKEISEMRPYVDFQPHSRYHAALTTTSREEMMEEIRSSKEDIETLLGREARHFSYPHGDYNEEVVDVVRECGFLSARTIDCGWVSSGSDPFRLKITGVSDNASLTELAAELCGITCYITRLTQLGITGKLPAAFKGSTRA